MLGRSAAWAADAPRPAAATARASVRFEQTNGKFKLRVSSLRGAFKVFGRWERTPRRSPGLTAFVHGEIEQQDLLSRGGFGVGQQLPGSADDRAAALAVVCPRHPDAVGHQ